MKSFIITIALAASSMAHVAHPDRRDKCKADSCQNVVNTPLCVAFQTRTVYATTSTVYVSRTSTISPSVYTSSTRSGDDRTASGSPTSTSSDDSLATPSFVRRGGGGGGGDKSTKKGGDDDNKSTTVEDRSSSTSSPSSTTEDRTTTKTTGLPPSVTGVCNGKSDVKSACECIGVPKGTITVSYATTVTRTGTTTPSATPSATPSTTPNTTPAASTPVSTPSSVEDRTSTSTIVV